MVMMFEPVRAALVAARDALGGPSRTVHLSPQGRRMEQRDVRNMVRNSSLVLICSRYEGVDERLIETEVDEELSLGDYVLSGGELAAMSLIDAMTRLIPGVLGNEESAGVDSFSSGLLDWPHYTRPEMAAGRRVPEVLLSGDHGEIRRWRTKQSLGRTWERRSDLLRGRQFCLEERTLLDEYLSEHEAPAIDAAALGDGSE